MSTAAQFYSTVQDLLVELYCLLPEQNHRSKSNWTKATAVFLSCSILDYKRQVVELLNISWGRRDGLDMI